MKNKINIQEDLEQSILHGLSYEWKNTLAFLDNKFSKSMRVPFFSLQEMVKKFGYWSLTKREICLSRNFVLNYPWDDVIEVLRHEMAHQMVDEVFYESDESAHGKTFLNACKILRANPNTSDDYKPLHEKLNDETLNSNDKILLRIKKLMALAESKNLHEAEVAMAKAHLLISKHNIDLLEQNKDRNFISIFVGKPVLRHFKEDYFLAHILTDFYFVYGIWVSSYVLEKGKMGRVLEISGTIQNVKIASYVYDFIKHYINSRWEEYNLNKNLDRYRKTDFAIGILEGFRQKLTTQNAKQYKNSKNFDLIKIKDLLLENYKNNRYPYRRSINHKTTNRDTNVLSDGIEEGKRLVISKGINNQEQGTTFLIES